MPRIDVNRSFWIAMQDVAVGASGPSKHGINESLLGLIAIRLGVFEFRKERAEPRLFMADAVTLELQPPPISRAKLLYSDTVSIATGRLDENKLILFILWRSRIGSEAQ